MATIPIPLGVLLWHHLRIGLHYQRRPTRMRAAITLMRTPTVSMLMVRVNHTIQWAMGRNMYPGKGADSSNISRTRVGKVRLVVLGSLKDLSAFSHHHQISARG